jgi:hypothetical protein
LVKDNPTFNEKKFLYRLSRTEYEKEWGSQYQKPGTGARLLALVIRIMPKIGPFKTLDITVPSSTTEDLYVTSVNKTVDSYDTDLASLLHGSRLALPNLDFDTGRPTELGEYQLADQTYDKLVDKLSARQFDLLTPELQANIVGYYANVRRDQPLKTYTADLNKVLAEVEALKSVNVEFKTSYKTQVGPGVAVR